MSTISTPVCRVSSRIVAIVKLMGGEDLIVFLGFVGEGILWYNSNYSNKGGLGMLPEENL